MWSITDQTTCVFPVTKVDEKEDVKSEADLAFEGRNDAEKAIWAQCKGSLYRSEMTTDQLFLIPDDAQDLVGAPVGLQMIGRKFEEEKVLQLVEITMRALGST